MPTNDIPGASIWLQPESAANTDYPPQYPYNNIQQTESGHSFEMDDTPTRERVRLQHRSGTFIEMAPDGSEVHKVYGNGFEITVQDKNIQIGGSCTIEVMGDCNLHVIGNKNEVIDGDYNLQVTGNMIARCKGTGGMQLLSDNDMAIRANENYGGQLSISAADNIYISSDLVVGGSIHADVITAESRIGTEALGGVSAGLAGFVSLTGGLSVGGSPVAVPGTVLASVNVTAPTANFGVMDAVLMTDLVNTAIFDSHFHIGNLGYPTTPSLLPMV